MTCVTELLHYLDDRRMPLNVGHVHVHSLVREWWRDATRLDTVFGSIPIEFRLYWWVLRLANDQRVSISLNRAISPQGRLQSLARAKWMYRNRLKWGASNIDDKSEWEDFSRGETWWRRDDWLLTVSTASGDANLLLTTWARRLWWFRMIADVASIIIGVVGLVLGVSRVASGSYIARWNQINATVTVAALLTILASALRHFTLVVVLLDNRRVIQQTQGGLIVMVTRQHMGMIVEEVVWLQIYKCTQWDCDDTKSTEWWTYQDQSQWLAATMQTNAWNRWLNRRCAPWIQATAAQAIWPHSMYRY